MFGLVWFDRCFDFVPFLLFCVASCVVCVVVMSLLLVCVVCCALRLLFVCVGLCVLLVLFRSCWFVWFVFGVI